MAKPMASRLLHETPHMARLNSALVVVLVATSALAQTTTTQVVTQPLIIRTQTSDFQDEIPFGPGECDSTFTVRWKYTSSLGTACSEVAFWSTTATSCGDAPLSSDKTYPSVSQAVLLISPSGNFNLKVAELPGFKTQTLEDGGVRAAATCGELNKETQHLVCGSANAGSFGTCGTFGGTTVTKLKASPLKLKYDTLPPAAPSITEAVATNGAATLSFSPNADAAYVVPIVTELLDGGQGGPVERAEVANENGPRARGFVKRQSKRMFQSAVF